MDSSFTINAWNPGDSVVRKIIFLLSVISFSSSASEMRLQEGDHKAVLLKVKDYWISLNCHNCEAQNVMEKSNPEKIGLALNKIKDGQIAPGTRVCNGLGGLVWSLKNSIGQTHSICEFKDKSYVLTDDLAGLVQKK